MAKKAINRVVFCWLLCYAALTHAASTLTQDIVGYDWLSLVLAGFAGALGGIARTILTLLTDKRPVLDLRAEALKDVAVALIGGLVVYLFIGGYNSLTAGLDIVKLPQITRDFRILLLVYAGFSRGRWFGTVDGFASDAINSARERLRGTPVPPSSIAATLEDTPK